MMGLLLVVAKSRLNIVHLGPTTPPQNIIRKDASAEHTAEVALDGAALLLSRCGVGFFPMQNTCCKEL